MGMISQFIVITLLLLEPICAVVGYGVGELFLMASNVLLSASSVTMEMIEAELTMFGGNATGHTSDPLLLRLFRTKRSIFWVTQAELQTLWNMKAANAQDIDDDTQFLRKDMLSAKIYRYGGEPGKDKVTGLAKMRHPKTAEGNNLQEQIGNLRTPLKMIYVVDHKDNLVIDVANARVIRSNKQKSQVSRHARPISVNRLVEHEASQVIV